MYTLCYIVFNTQSVERMETLRGKLRKEHEEKEDQLKEKFVDKEDRLRERLAEREDQLREKLAEKDAHIKSHLKEISDLQQQLKVTLFTI